MGCGAACCSAGGRCSNERGAPVAGRVGRLEITVGNLVAAGPGAPVLTTLVSVNPIYASFDADEHVVLRALKEGKRDVPVEAETVTNGGTHLRGRLQLIDNQVNTKSGTVRARAVFDDRDRALIPGQFVKLRMGRAKSEQALLVSERLPQAMHRALGDLTHDLAHPVGWDAARCKAAG